jgi:hypothetical protein
LRAGATSATITLAMKNQNGIRQREPGSAPAESQLESDRYGQVNDQSAFSGVHPHPGIVHQGAEFAAPKNLAGLIPRSGLIRPISVSCSKSRAGTTAPQHSSLHFTYLLSCHPNLENALPADPLRPARTTRDLPTCPKRSRQSCLPATPVFALVRCPGGTPTFDFEMWTTDLFTVSRSEKKTRSANPSPYAIPPGRLESPESNSPPPTLSQCRHESRPESSN